MGHAHVTSLDDYRFARGEEKKPILSGLKYKVAAVFNRQLGAVGLLSLLMGQSALMGELSGVAVPFWLLLFREDQKWGYVSLPLMVLSRGAAIGHRQALALVAAALTMIAIEKTIGSRWYLPFPLSAAAGFAAGSIPLLQLGMGSPYYVIILGLDLALTVVIAFLIQPLSGSLLSVHLSNPEQEEKIGLVVLAGCLLLGFRTVSFAGLPLGNMFMWLFLTAGAYVFGGGWGAGAGLLAGIVMGLTGGQQGLALITQMAMIGFLSGTFRSFGRLGSGLGFFTAVWFPAAFGMGSSVSWVSIALTMAIFFLIPRQKIIQLKRLEPVLNPSDQKSLASGESRQVLSRRIREFSLVFKQLADAFACAVPDSERQDMVDMVSSLADKVCDGCMFYRRCWKKDYYSTYQSICNLMVAVKPVTADKLPAPVSRYCPRAGDLVNALNGCQEVLQAEGQWRQRLSESQEMVSHQLTGLAQVMNELAQEINLNAIEIPREEAEDNIRFGAAQDNASPGDVCGDAYGMFSYRGEHYFVISDGMGKGSSARSDSETAIKLLESLIQAGFKRELALRNINTLLKLRGQESFATLDMAVINSSEGLLELIKIGAPPSYLVRNKEVFVLKGGSPPMGMLEHISPGFSRQQVYPGDLVVMVSDGVVEPPDQERWLQEFLQHCEGMDPDKLADSLLTELKGKAGLEDDRTVLVLQIL